MNIKKCRQCGEIRPTDQFRSYYGNRSGTYTTCRSCERVNSRFKYLRRKSAAGAATEEDTAELEQIEQLYAYQKAAGLKPPATRDTVMKDAMVAKMLQAYKNRSATEPAIPVELQQWLEAELTDVPEYYLDTVYEGLLAKYRPLIRIEQESMTPVYDTKYVEVLNQILERFNNYEDSYYEGD